MPIKVGDPATWTEDEAREFLHTLQRLQGAGVKAQRLHETADGVVIEVVGAGGTVTTPPLRLSSAAKEWLGRMMFELPRTGT